MTAGEQLRRLRESLGLTIRDVEAASAKLAEKHGQPDYAISLSRLSDIETKDITPNIFKLYSFSVIYRRSFAELLAFYGVLPHAAARDEAIAPMAKTHLVTRDLPEHLHLPVRMDPGFDARTTTALSRMIAAWGTAPLGAVEHFKSHDFTYGYIGLDDLTMYPLLLPGTLVQVDESRRRVEEGPWRSEMERPIYFLETREGFLCSWCELSGTTLTVRPHALSPVKTRSLKNGSEVEVLGQVVGIAMRLDGWLASTGTPPPAKDSST